MDKRVGLYGVDNRMIFSLVIDGFGLNRELGGYVDGVCKFLFVDII